MNSKAAGRLREQIQHFQTIGQKETFLQKALLSVKLVPTPRQFSSDCGVALRFTWPALEQVLAAAKVEIDVIHPLE